MGDKRSASPSSKEGGKPKKSRRGSGRGRGGRGGFYGGPPPPGMGPPWGPPPPPPGFPPRPPPPPPFPGRGFGYFPPPGTCLVLYLTVHNLSRVVRKPAFCIFENKDADQDQRLCFRYTDSTIPLLPKSEI